MNCPICKKELEIKNKKVGENAAGEAIYNEFAICHDCKKQWNLDKQRAKANVAAKANTEKTEIKTAEVSKKAPVVSETPSDAAPTPKKKRPVSSDEQAQPVRKVKKKRPVNPETVQAKEPVTSSKSKAAPVKVTESVKDAPTRVIPTNELEAKLQEISAPEERPRKKKRPVPSDVQEQPVRKVKKKRPVNPETVSDTPEVSTEAAPAPKKKRPATNGQPKRSSSDVNIQERPHKKRRRPVESLEDDMTEFSNALAEEMNEKTYSNIPPKHIREAREKEMRENYQNMLDEEDEGEEGGAPIILILIIIILLLAIAAFAGYWFLLR